MSSKNKHFYRFRDFQIDTVNRRLLHGGEAVPLKAKAVEILLILLENRGDVVEKSDLMERLWADSFVEDANLTQNVYTLRKALGGEFIETIPRRGYRFDADVEEWDEAGEVIVIHEKTRMTLDREESFDEPVENEEAAAALRARTGTTWRLLIASSSIAVLASVCIAGYFLLRRAETPYDNVRLGKLTTTGNVLKATISPDGKDLAFVASEPDGQSLWIRRIAAGKDLRIITPERTDIYGVTFSRDGEFIYFVSQQMNRMGILFRVPILGGEPVRLAEDVDSPVTFSPDDRRMAFLRGSAVDHGIFVANSDGSAETKIAASTANDPFTIGPVWKIPPAWSPDGKTIACTVGLSSTEGKYQTLRGFDVETGKAADLTSQHWEIVGRSEWLESGLLVTAAGTGDGFVQQVWHVDTRSGEARKITSDLSDYQDLSATPDGRMIVAVHAERKGNIQVAPMDDINRIKQVTSANYDGLEGAVYTPDNRIVFTRRVSGGQDLWITDLSSGESRSLISLSGFIIQPTVSPDGRYVVFALSLNGRSHIWRTDVNGREPIELTRGEEDVTPTITGDSQFVIYRSFGSGSSGLMRVPISGGEAETITDQRVFEPQVSPDGTTLAVGYRSAPSALNKLAVMPILGGDPRPIVDLPAYYGVFIWYPDNSALAYASRQGPAGNIWLQPKGGGPAQQLTSWKPEPIYSFAFSRDGKQIAFASGPQTTDAIVIREPLQ